MMVSQQNIVNKVTTFLISAYDLFSQYLVHKLIYLVFQLCRQEFWAHKAETWLINGIWKNTQLCRVFADPVTSDLI